MAKEKKSNPMTLQELREALREKKDHDEKFAKLMKDQPKLAVEKCLGQKLPENIKVHLVEDELDKLYVILPANPEEISDEMLERIAGGGSLGDAFGGFLLGLTKPVKGMETLWKAATGEIPIKWK